MTAFSQKVEAWRKNFAGVNTVDRIEKLAQEFNATAEAMKYVMSEEEEEGYMGDPNLKPTKFAIGDTRGTFFEGEGTHNKRINFCTQTARHDARVTRGHPEYNTRGNFAEEVRRYKDFNKRNEKLKKTKKALSIANLLTFFVLVGIAAALASCIILNIAFLPIPILCASALGIITLTLIIRSAFENIYLRKKKETLTKVSNLSTLTFTEIGGDTQNKDAEFIGIEWKKRSQKNTFLFVTTMNAIAHQELTKLSTGKPYMSTAFSLLAILSLMASSVVGFYLLSFTPFALLAPFSIPFYIVAGSLVAINLLLSAFVFIRGSERAYSFYSFCRGLKRQADTKKDLPDIKAGRIDFIDTLNAETMSGMTEILHLLGDIRKEEDLENFQKMLGFCYDITYDCFSAFKVTSFLDNQFIIEVFKELFYEHDKDGKRKGNPSKKIFKENMEFLLCTNPELSLMLPLTGVSESEKKLRVIRNNVRLSRTMISNVHNYLSDCIDKQKEQIKRKKEQMEAKKEQQAERGEQATVRRENADDSTEKIEEIDTSVYITGTQIRDFVKKSLIEILPTTKGNIVTERKGFLYLKKRKVNNVETFTTPRGEVNTENFLYNRAYSGDSNYASEAKEDAAIASSRGDGDDIAPKDASKTLDPYARTDRYSYVDSVDPMTIIKERRFDYVPQEQDDLSDDYSMSTGGGSIGGGSVEERGHRRGGIFGVRGHRRGGSFGGRGGRVHYTDDLVGSGFSVQKAAIRPRPHQSPMGGGGPGGADYPQYQHQSGGSAGLFSDSQQHNPVVYDDTPDAGLMVDDTNSQQDQSPNRGSLPPIVVNATPPMSLDSSSAATFVHTAPVAPTSTTTTGTSSSELPAAAARAPVATGSTHL